MALEVIKPPLQPAAQGAGGSYGNGPMLFTTQMDHNIFSAENCNPNMDKEAVTTPGRCTPKKTPVKSKTATLSENGHDFGKSPVRRRLDCDGGGMHEAMGKSPVAKSASLKDTGHKHFCRSPRCAANNPDYAVPAPRQYLKSKRHLLAGWQPPLNSKLKAPVPSTHGCSSNNHIASEGAQIKEHEQVQEPNHVEEHNASCSETGVCGNVGESSQAGGNTNDDSPHRDSKCSTQHAPQIDSLNPQYGTAHAEEVVSDVKDRTELLTMEPQDVYAAEDLSLENMDEAILSVESTSTCITIGEEVLLSTTNQEVSVFRADPARASMRTDSDLSMWSIGEALSDSRRETAGSLRPPPRRRYHKKGGRRISSGTSSTQSMMLNKQEGLKRKQAEEWMWDTAIKDAVQRLAPQAPVAGSVNVLVKAFESVKLTEEEIQRAKYNKNMAIGRLAMDGSPFHGGDGGFEMEAIASINKVQAWDESMASADLVEEMSIDKVIQDEEKCPLTPKRSQARIPQFSSKSVPPKVGSSRWASASDESMNGTKDDTCSERGASSTSGKSRTTEWTLGGKSQVEHTRKHKLQRCTSLHPFRLRTEERGAVKEYMFSKRLQQLWQEEERLRIPLAQGLPWTTEEPAVPPKPLVKEQTKPERFKLLTDVRAIERAEFDGYIAERNSQIELQKQEEERHRQIAEEEEVRRLRREMVPRAQLMPYFDRPFMPRRSSKKLTVPREPKFHLKQNKRPRCTASCNSIAA